MHPGEAEDTEDDAEAIAHRDEALDALVAARLSALADDAVVVVPASLDGVVGRYRPDDVYAVKDLRRFGVAAEFLHGPDERVFLHEHSSGTLLNFSLGFIASLSATGAAALVKYMLAKTRPTDSDPGEPEQRIRIELRGYRGEGIRIRCAVIEGPANEATQMFLREVRGESPDD